MPAFGTAAQVHPPSRALSREAFPAAGAAGRHTRVDVFGHGRLPPPTVTVTKRPGCRSPESVIPGAAGGGGAQEAVVDVAAAVARRRIDQIVERTSCR
ncbi:hypothetical protein GCM10023223_10230 [Stackebrandtia albiflava]